MRKNGITVWFATVLVGLSLGSQRPDCLRGGSRRRLDRRSQNLRGRPASRRPPRGATARARLPDPSTAWIRACVDYLSEKLPPVPIVSLSPCPTSSAPSPAHGRPGPSTGRELAPGAGELPLDLARGEVPPAPTVVGPKVVGLDGDWAGVLDINGSQLRLALHVKTTPAEGTTATLDSIDQNALGIPVSAISREGPHVRLELKALAATFDGNLEPGNQKIAGTWTQSSLSLPLTLQQRPAGAKQPP